jgi:hypothetical protein
MKEVCDVCRRPRVVEDACPACGRDWRQACTCEADGEVCTCERLKRRIKASGCYPGGSLWARTFETREDLAAWASRRKASVWTAWEEVKG